MNIDMNSQQDSFSNQATHRPLNSYQLSSPSKRFLELLTHYDTPKLVRFESKWIATSSLLVKLSLIVGCLYLMFQKSSYQVFDRSPISAVTIKVKPASDCLRSSIVMKDHFKFPCSQSEYDVNDFVLPPTENSAISITTRTLKIEHVLRLCDKTKVENHSNKNLSLLYAVSIRKCEEQAHCILPFIYRDKYDENTGGNESRLCWFKLNTDIHKRNYQALDYILAIKNFVEFPQLGLIRQNLDRDIIAKDKAETCEYDPDHDPLCPKFRILKIFQQIEKNTQEYEPMLFNGSLIEIKIIWNCNLDIEKKYCEPLYRFKRLDSALYQDNPYQNGSKFLTSVHFFRPNDQELHRVHTTIYNLHIIVSVTGAVRKFDLFQTTTSIGSFVGIVSMGTIVCDIIAAFFMNFKSVKYDSG